MAETVAGLLAIAGCALIALAGLGMFRLPDALTRASAVSKAATLGLVLVLGAALIEAQQIRTLVVLVLILLAHLVTVSLAALALGRASYLAGAARPPVTKVDEPARRDQSMEG